MVVTRHENVLYYVHGAIEPKRYPHKISVYITRMTAADPGKRYVNLAEKG